jgi:hypothetical protein
MPINNPYYIPKENLPKVEQVIYLDQNYQPQSYEEFMKTYQTNEAVEIITEAEWQDRVLNGPQYGPGNSQSSETAGSVLKVALKTTVSTVAAGALVAATGGVGAIAIGGLVAAEGYCIKKASENSDNEAVRAIGGFVGDLAFDTGIGTVTGGAFGTATSSLASQGTKSIGHQAAREIAKNGRQMTEGARLLISCGKTLAELANDLRAIEKAYGVCSDAYEIVAHNYHGKHKDEGYGYKSDCPVCKGTV